MADLHDDKGTPFFMDVTDINDDLSVGMLFDSPALLVRNESGGKFIRLSAPDARRLADTVRELAQ